MLMNAYTTNNFFDDFFGNGGFIGSYDKKHKGNGCSLFDLSFAGDQMKTDIKETETGYKLAIDLPGYELENIKGEVKDGYLTITASNEFETSEEDSKKNEKKNGYVFRERYTGSCSRSYYVGEEVTQADIKAVFKNGVLTVDVPKKEKKELPEDRFIMIEG